VAPLRPKCRAQSVASLANRREAPRLGRVADYYEAYLPLVVILVIGVLLVGAMFGGNRLLRPSHATAEKLLTYECGVDPVGEGWAQNHVRYYVYAFLYVIFAVDAVFLFPWATVFDGLGWTSVAEMGVFIGFIAVGLLYAWRKGVLLWT
jgi:NADH-quinone oxidoreductase subunit A